MSNMTSAATVAAGTKTLWVAVGVLGAAVVGLGGALYYTQSHKSDEVTAASTSAAPAVAAPGETVVKPAAVEAHTPAATATPARPAPAKSSRHAAAPRSGPAEAPTPVVVQPVCADCATVVAVTPVEREGEAGGTGAVAGGVLGALVGNQFGRGQGKDVATVIGAIGGGIAGNQVEKKMKKVTVYQVELRMDDGSRRTLELAAPVAVGERVRYDNGALQALQR